MTDYYSRCGAEDAAAEAAYEEAAATGRLLSRDSLRDAISNRHRCECLNPSWWWGSIFAPFEPCAGLPDSAMLKGVCMACKGCAVRFTGSRSLVWSYWEALDSARLKIGRAWCPVCDKPCHTCKEKEIALNKRWHE